MSDFNSYLVNALQSLPSGYGIDITLCYGSSEYKHIRAYLYKEFEGTIIDESKWEEPIELALERLIKLAKSKPLLHNW